MIRYYKKEEKHTQIEKYLLLNIYQRRDCILNELEELEENEAFFTGLICGIKIFQQKIVMAHKRREHLMIDGNAYYVQSGRERLQEAIDKICK